MIILFIFLFGGVVYLYNRSKDEASLIEGNQTGRDNEELEEDDLFNNLEDLFI